ncbi:MAG: hypothetical protein JJ879_02240 [Sneathiella sp.]|nr:hypothetical protein [Sneathiella sp.]
MKRKYSLVAKHPFASFTTQRTPDGLWIVFPSSGVVRKIRLVGHIITFVYVGTTFLIIFLKLDVPSISNLIFGAWTQPAFILAILGTTILGTGWFKKSIIITRYATELNALDDEPELEDIKTIPPRVRFYVTEEEAAKAQLYRNYLSVKNSTGEFVVGNELSEIDREKLLGLLQEQAIVLKPIPRKNIHKIPEEDHTPLLERMRKLEQDKEIQENDKQLPNVPKTKAIKPPGGSAIEVLKTRRGNMLRYSVTSDKTSFIKRYFAIGLSILSCVLLYRISDQLTLLWKLYGVIGQEEFLTHERVQGLLLEIAPTFGAIFVILCVIPVLVWPKRKEKIHIEGLEVIVEKGGSRNPLQRKRQLSLLLSDLKNLNLSGDRIIFKRGRDIISFAEGLNEEDRSWIIDTLKANNKYVT